MTAAETEMGLGRGAQTEPIAWFEVIMEAGDPRGSVGTICIYSIPYRSDGQYVDGYYPDLTITPLNIDGMWWASKVTVSGVQDATINALTVKVISALSRISTCCEFIEQLLAFSVWGFQDEFITYESG